MKLNRLFLKFFVISLIYLIKPNDRAKNFRKMLFSFTGVLMDLRLQTNPTL